MAKGHSDQTTAGIRVRVAAEYLPEHSDPERKRWVYAYRVVLTSRGGKRAKLVSRHWVIRDASNDVREVRGPGVVGEQPDLAPGESFTYTSACPLATE